VKFEYLDAFKRLDQIDAFFQSDQPGKAFLWLHLFEPHEPYDARAGYEFGTSDVDRYDSEIAYTDAAVGKLVAYVEKTARRHHHRHRRSRRGVRRARRALPRHLAVRGAGARAADRGRCPGCPARGAGPVELIDLAPTILGLVDIPRRAHARHRPGPWLGVPPGAAARLPPAFAEVAEQRMIAWGTEKLVCR
jgi:hypothetical protein